MRRLWLAITLDKYELPYAVADSYQELAKMVGRSPSSIQSAISHHKHGRWKRSRYITVDVEEWED